MNLLRIGHTVINLDRVEEIDYFPAIPPGAAGRMPMDDRLCLTFAGAPEDGSSRDLYGDEARRAWRAILAIANYGDPEPPADDAAGARDDPPPRTYAFLGLPEGEPVRGRVPDLGALHDAAGRLARAGYRGVLAIDSEGAAWGSLTIRSAEDWTVEATGGSVVLMPGAMIL